MAEPAPSSTFDYQIVSLTSAASGSCQTLSHQGKVKSQFIMFVCGSALKFTLLCHVSQILDVHNVMVVVSRWYGGVLLGPDRFKHINNCARNILVEEGYVGSVVRPSLDPL